MEDSLLDGRSLLSSGSIFDETVLNVVINYFSVVFNQLECIFKDPLLVLSFWHSLDVLLKDLEVLDWNSLNIVHVLQKPNLSCLLELPCILLLLPNNEVVQRVPPHSSR